MQDLQRAIDDLRRRAQRASEAKTLSELEQEARDLLAEAKNTPLEASAQALFAEIASSGAAGPRTNVAAIRALVRRARIRIEIAGDDDDIDEAIDILADALQLDPGNDDAVSLLRQAAERSPQARQRVQELFARHGISASLSKGGPAPTPPPPALPEAPTPSPRPAQPSPYQPPEAEAPQPIPQSGAAMDELLTRLNEAYYAGDYQLTIDVANRILAIQPNSPTAQEYREKSEDNLIRGIIPDHRIPFEARVAYNRANSLVRAGNYEQASGLYREARELAERDGILTWKDVEQALLEIQDLALARELLSDGDRLLAIDSFSEALRKYEGALRVVPNDPHAEERLEMARRVQRDVDQVAVNMNTIGGTLEEQVSQIGSVRALLSQTRQLLPNSPRMSQLQKELDNKLAAIRSQVNDQAQMTLNHANNSTTLDERVLLINAAIKLLELGLELDPTDSGFSDALMRSRNLQADISRAQGAIKRAQALISQNFDAELAQARQMLADLVGEFAQDERYRGTVNELFTRYLERAEEALQEGNMREARTWLDAMREEPFRILGRRTDLSRVENVIRRQRARGRLVMAFALIILLTLGGAATAMTQPQWMPILFPTATPTPTITPTATATFTPSATPTASHTPTDTATPTNTFTPTATFTPSNTPTATPTSSNTPTPTNTPTMTATPPVLCRAMVPYTRGVRLRTRATTASPVYLTVPERSALDILAQQYDGSGTKWYLVRFHDENNDVTGYVRHDTVSQFGNQPCPEMPGSRN